LIEIFHEAGVYMTMSFDSSDFEKKLNELSKNVDKISGKNTYALEEIFSKQFMMKHTNANSIGNFFDNSPFRIESQEDFESLPEEKLDKYVAENTRFSTWSDMLGAATEKLIAKKLGF